MTRILIVAAIAIAGFDAVARSQTAPTPPAPPQPSPAAPPSATSPSPTVAPQAGAHVRILGLPSASSPAARPINDPTIPSAEIRELMNQATASPGQAPAAPPPLPIIRLKARVFVRDKPPVAVIEVESRQLTVRQGSEIFWTPSGDARGAKLRVAELTPNEIRIEVMERNQVLTID